MTRNLFRALAVSLTLAVWFSTTSVRAVVIDDFSTANTPALLQINGGSGGPATDNDDSGLAGVVGGVREVTLTRTSGTAGDIRAEVTGGEMRFQTLNVIDSANFLLVYDAVTGVGVGDVAADLTAGGTNAFGVAFSAASGGTTPVTINVFDGTNSGAATVNYLGGPGTLVIPYSNVGFAGVNFASINTVSLQVTGVFDGDYFISLFESQITGDPQAVPEPSTIVLAAISLLGVLIFRVFGLARN